MDIVNVPRLCQFLSKIVNLQCTKCNVHTKCTLYMIINVKLNVHEECVFKLCCKCILF
jgi:hypothetical protein